MNALASACLTGDEYVSVAFTPATRASTAMVAFARGAPASPRGTCTQTRVRAGLRRSTPSASYHATQCASMAGSSIVTNAKNARRLRRLLGRGRGAAAAHAASGAPARAIHGVPISRYSSKHRTTQPRSRRMVAATPLIFWAASPFFFYR